MLNLQEFTLKISARNVIKGTVKQVIHGAVNSEVIIMTANGEEVFQSSPKNRQRDWI
jgi:molybdopterin-binding protein